jgi:hypothetical protein
MILAVAENLTQLRGMPTNFSFDNGNKPLLSNVVQSAFVIPQISTRSNSVKFNLKDFNYGFALDLVDFDWEEFSPIAQLKLKIADDVFVKLVLTGSWEKHENIEQSTFHLNDVGVALENTSEIPLSNFVAATFWAMLGLSKNCSISIESINYNFNLAFDIPISKISDLLQERQIAYRLMVIEKALEIQLPFPRRFRSGEEIGNIAYCYHSIVDRNFEWHFEPTVIPWLATQMYQSILPIKNEPFQMQYGPEPFGKEVFGQPIFLGLQVGKIKNYVIENFDEVKNAVSKLDGKEVLAKVRSKDGVMQIESVTTPELSMTAFSKDIQKLIDLESKLIDAVFEKHVNSYSNAFEGLSDEQIEVLTERPILEEEAFNF